MEKILFNTLNAFLYFVSATFLIVSILLLYAAYRDSDLELSLFALLGFVGTILVFNTAGHPH